MERSFIDIWVKAFTLEFECPFPPCVGVCTNTHTQLEDMRTPFG
jgi:hypothetical protein